MKRIHLFEFEDQDKLPFFLRVYMTDFLSYLACKMDIFEPIIPLIKKGIQASELCQIIDLGSGSGGGWAKLSLSLHHSNPKIQIFLSDFFPNENAITEFDDRFPNVTYLKESIDALNVPKTLIGLRTMFLAFHHFEPKKAVLILQNAVQEHQPIAIFEGQERSLKSIVGMIFSPITLLLFTPWIRPFAYKRILFTYLIPILPLLVFWDGLVSCLRTYELDELKALVEKVDDHEKFNWETGKVKSGPGKILYLLGTPK